VGSLRGYWPVMGARLALASELVFNSDRLMRDGRDAGPALLGRVFASGRLPGDRLSYRIGITNLLDWDWSVPVNDGYDPVLAIPQVGRTVMAQLTYEGP